MFSVVVRCQAAGLHAFGRGRAEGGGPGRVDRPGHGRWPQRRRGVVRWVQGWVGISGGNERMGPCLLVERLRRQVDTAWPNDGPRLRIDPDLSEVGRVIQRLQDTGPSLGREVDITGCGVAEEQPEHLVAYHGNTYHNRQVVFTHTHNPTPAAR